MNGSELIAAERRRQIEVEGWTEKYDAVHAFGELGLAGSSYHAFGDFTQPPGRWPWEPRWWKPTTDRVRRFSKPGRSTRRKSTG